MVESLTKTFATKQVQSEIKGLRKIQAYLSGLFYCPSYWHQGSPSNIYLHLSPFGRTHPLLINKSKVKSKEFLRTGHNCQVYSTVLSTGIKVHLQCHEHLCISMNLLFLYALCQSEIKGVYNRAAQFIINLMLTIFWPSWVISKPT